MTRPFLAPPAVSAEEFVEIEPVTDKKGRVLRRFRHKLTGAVGVEVPFELVECGEVTPEPMTLPSSSIFYLDYHYEGKDSHE